MKNQQAHKEAAKLSKDGATRYVVYVFDEGTDVYDADTARRFGPLISIEAAYLNGVKIADMMVAA